MKNENLIKKIVIERIKNMSSNVKIALGSKGEFLGKNELLNEVNQDTIIGKKIIQIQLNYLQALKEGTICNKGNLKKQIIKEEMFGVYLGNFPAQVCSACSESFTDSKTTKKIEEIAKKKGIWGLGVKTKITRTGNSLAIRIPKKIADYLKLKEGKEAYVHPDAGRLVVES